MMQLVLEWVSETVLSMERKQGVEDTIKNLGEASNEVASGEETMLCATTSRSQLTEKGSVVSTAGGMGQGIPSLPLLPSLLNSKFILRGISVPPIHWQHHHL